jgi:tRNA threonylcarbamoyladenosine biosynthesis protein TsaE
VAVIEWADKFPSQMPDERLWLEIKTDDGANKRIITFKPVGTRYQLLCEELKHFAGTGFRYGNSRV